MRIAYLATADARGHLMRAQLLTRALRAEGVRVDVITTSEDGVRFFAGFGIAATLLSPHYAVQFDGRQNMRRRATDANVAAYLFRPSRLLRDLRRLGLLLAGCDLVVDDSFHPALLVMGGLPRWRDRVVHVYGRSLREALETNFEGRLPGWLARGFARLVGRCIDASRARLVHDFAHADAPRREGNCIRLPTPVAVPEAAPPAAAPGDPARAAVYLNPHFRDPALAGALERGLADAGLGAHCVGEGYRGRAGWQAIDPGWVAQAAASALIVSAPGMAALSVALVYDRPIVLVLTDQPEQRRNAARAAALGLCHRSVEWRGDAPAFAHELRAACTELRAQATPADAARGRARADARLRAWTDTLRSLAAA